MELILSKQQIDVKIDDLQSLYYADIDAENKLLCCLLFNVNLMSDVMDEITSESFSKFENALLFDLLVEIRESGQGFDCFTVVNFIEKAKNSQTLKKNYLDVIRYDIYMGNFKAYLTSVKLAFVRKQVHKLSQEMLKVTTSDKDPRDIIDNTCQLLADLLTNIDIKSKNVVNLTNPKDAGLILNDIFNQRTGLPTKFFKIDKLLGGFTESEVTVIAARPSVGKTALAINLSLGVVLNTNFKVLFFSLEMTAEKIAERILTHLLRTTTSSLKNMTQFHMDEYKNTLIASNVIIVDTSNININSIKNISRIQCLRNRDIKLIVIDYIQLIEAKGKFENRQHELAKITRELKNLSSELNIPLLVLSQLSRETEASSLPKLSHIKSSGTIEEHFDNIFLMKRDATLKPFHPLDNNEVKIHLILAKHRNGPTGDVIMKFLPDINTFIEV